MRGFKKILISTVPSAVHQWTEEFEKWMGYPCVPLIGTKAQRDKAVTKWTHGLVVSHDTLKETARSNGELNRLLSCKPEAFIFDEAHRMKNASGSSASAISKAAFKCTSIPYRIALTGTPAPNKSHEIWAILHFLYPDMFKSYWAFIEQNYVTALQSNRTGKSYKDILYLKPGRRKWLQETLDMIATQRKRKDVMPWLPPKDYQKVKLPLTKEQAKYIKELEDVWETEHVITQGILDRLMRYRQICLAPQLLELKGRSPKIDWIGQYLKDYPDKSIIIFSKFTSFLKILSEHHKDAGVLIGETPINKRHEYCKEFQAGNIKVLLINIDVGKEALTLDRAEVAIFADKYPPAGTIAQAEDRFIATTEENADKSHTIIELMMKDSYDEQLYKLVEKRKEESDIVNNYKEYLQRRKSNDCC